MSIIEFMSNLEKSWFGVLHDLKRKQAQPHTLVADMIDLTLVHSLFSAQVQKDIDAVRNEYYFKPPAPVDNFLQALITVGPVLAAVLLMNELDSLSMMPLKFYHT